MKYKIAILRNESPNDHLLWVKSCDKRKDQIDYDIIDITSNDWLSVLTNKDYDLYLTRPPGLVSIFKQLYDERIWIIEQILGKKIYPSFQEDLLYENKRLLSYWLKAFSLPHPATDVFYFKEEALEHINKTNYPFVAKTNIGASGIGVKIIRDKSEAEKYIKNIFSLKGQKKKTGPKIFKGNPIQKIKKVLTQDGFLKNRISEYKSMADDKQKGFLIFQEFVQHEFEWRCVIIGESYFAHKKLVTKGKASGTLQKSYDSPPLELFIFLKKLKEKTGISSAAIDLFEQADQKYLINEIQCFFGHSDPFQMKVDNEIGRYRYINNSWVFEEGDFNTNESYDLRLEHALEMLNSK